MNEHYRGAVRTTCKQLMKDTEAAPGLRVWPASPNMVNLQVRALRGSVPHRADAYMTATDVRELRDYLTAVLAEHFGER